MLGTDLRATLGDRGVEVQSVGRADLDLLDPDAVAAAVGGNDVVVNCAAWTAVDDAEEHEAEAFTTNAVAAGLLARAARRHDATIVQVSTDYVFDGDAGSPYAEDAALGPRSAYGRTKAAGEWAVRAEAPRQHLIVRTAWLYGAHGGCFPRTIARLARERGAVDVVADQLGQPSWTRDVSDLIVRLVEANAPVGTWHATAEGEASWFEFAQRVVESAGLSADVVSPVDAAAFPRGARRPAYSVLGHDKLDRLGIEPIGDWRARWEVAASVVLAAVDQR